MSELLSVLIPSRNEPYLQQTIEDLLKHSKEDIEIIAVLDGYWPPQEALVHDKRVKYIHFPQARGMRNAINSAFRVSNGTYILKTDAHCMFEQDFDVKLKENCEDTWVVVPRRLRLDPVKWELTENGKPPSDYMYTSCPDGGVGLHGREWNSKNLDPQLKEKKIDDLMDFQGSCWFMKRSTYEHLELMDEEHYGTFPQEAQEIALKCWLSGGRVVINKNTWYAHWHKSKQDGRGYSLDRKEVLKGHEYVIRWMKEKMWHKQIHDISWLVKKFNPPTWEKYNAQ